MQITVNALFAAAGCYLMALGFTLIFATVRFFPLSHAIPYATAPYLAYGCLKHFSLPLWLSIVLGIVCSGLIGGLLELCLFGPLRRKQATPGILLLASLGLVVVVQSGISMVFGDQTLVLRHTGSLWTLSAMGASFTVIQGITVLGAIVVFGGAWLVQRTTRVGTIQRAVADDPELARAMGISVDAVYFWVFFVGSALAGVAGILAAMDTDLVPTMGFNALLLSVVAAIAGGIGSIPGTLLGSLIVGTAMHLGGWFFPTEWQYVIVFCVLIGFLLFRPQGWLGGPPRRATT